MNNSTHSYEANSPLVLGAAEIHRIWSLISSGFSESTTGCYVKQIEDCHTKACVYIFNFLLVVLDNTSTWSIFQTPSKKKKDENGRLV
jgi:hypothetical protein